MNNPIQTNPHARHRARCLAVQALYQWHMATIPSHELIAQHMATANPKKVDLDYFQDLIAGILKQTAALDEHIAKSSAQEISHIDPIELAVLRLGTYELLYHVEIPFKVVINEALRVNKKFGTSEGYRFINGVLDQLGKTLRATEQGLG